ncbi:HNH endonuclease signature motif containing protein [Nocardioides psychrotolerans]|uniref:HNH endonuclease n=1 Tax=Nocardioides psychrotolerans TaxID=1005945 RepID=UPI0031377B26
MWEMRTASPVNAENMRYLWKETGQPSVVVNSERTLTFFMRAGGNAVIAEPVFRQWFGNLLEPVECVPSRVGEGIRAVSSATPAELQHAPSRNIRMEVLKRDQFRCKACGQRPAEDPNIVLHVHHVRPWGQGGLTGMHNLLTLCHTCHTGLDPHFEWQLLTMVPDGVVATMPELEDNLKAFAEGVRRYREIVAAQLKTLEAETPA